MAVDLHTHSTASDGSETPGRLVQMAEAIGLTAIAVTDHDTLQGVGEARGAATSIEVVPGVELSLQWDKGGMHLLVLWLEPGPGPLQDRLDGLQAGRDGRNAAMVARLRDLGFDVTLEEVERKAGGGSVGRPHMAAVLVEKGYVTDIPTAFELYLAAGRPAYVGRIRLAPEEALDLACRSGGVPVLAHPHTLGIEDRFEMGALLERLQAAGLAGIECHYGTYGRDGRAGMVALARRFGLIPAGGSDFHGAYKPDVALGTGKVGVGVPDEVLAELAGARRAPVAP